MNGSSITMTTTEWQRHYDELVSLLTSRTGQSGGQAWEPTLDRRIAELRSTLARAVPCPAEDAPHGTVTLGSSVTVRWQDGLEETYRIVPPENATTLDGMISYQSPVGQAVYGRRAGQRVAVATPVGPDPIEIVAVADPAVPAPALDLRVDAAV